MQAGQNLHGSLRPRLRRERREGADVEHDNGDIALLGLPRDKRHLGLPDGVDEPPRQEPANLAAADFLGSGADQCHARTVDGEGQQPGHRQQYQDLFDLGTE